MRRATHCPWSATPLRQENPTTHTMKSILLSLLLVPALAIAADEKPKKPAPGKGGDREFKAGPRGKKDPAKAEEAYKKMDKDSDGKLTLDEFKAGGRPRPGKPGDKPEPPKPPDAPKAPTPPTPKAPDAQKTPEATPKPN
jgi:hypothetical protein